MDVDQREEALARLSRQRHATDLIAQLKSLVLLVAGTNAAAPDLLKRSLAVGPARPDPGLDVTPSKEWPGRKYCDAIVIGSGAGGAMAARTLARAGMDVVIVEEGRRFSVEEFRTQHPLERFGSLYRDAGGTVALGRPPVLLPVGRGVGGTTLVNSGTCYRTPDRVLERWRDEAHIGWADPERFAPYLDEVETTLHVAPQPLDVIGRNAELALRGAKALGWRAAPLRRNTPGARAPVSARSDARATLSSASTSTPFLRHVRRGPGSSAKRVSFASITRMERLPTSSRPGRTGRGSSFEPR